MGHGSFGVLVVVTSGQFSVARHHDCYLMFKH